MSSSSKAKLGGVAHRPTRRRLHLLPQLSSTSPSPSHPLNVFNEFDNVVEYASKNSQSFCDVLQGSNDHVFPITPSTTPVNATRTLQLFNRKSAKDTVSNLRRLRKHGETAIYNRYMHMAAPLQGNSEYKKYFDPCEKLLEFARFASFVLFVISLTVML